MNQDKLSALRKDRIMSISIGEGIKYGTLCGGLVGTGTYFASKFYPAFNKSMSVSAKASLPVVNRHMQYRCLIRHQRID